MNRRKRKRHLYWRKPIHGHNYKTACGKYLPIIDVTPYIKWVTCKNCLATIYGRPERTTP